jgi:hypothetical protein
MRNRRYAVVAALVVVELWIVGLMMRSLAGGGRETSVATSAASLGDAPPQVIETGAAPHVEIDDDTAILSVSVREGTTVSVTQQTRRHGWAHGSREPASVVKTSDGVRIVDAGSSLTFSMGSLDRRIDVVVPPGTTLDVQNAASATVTGLRGPAKLHSDDGTVVVNDHRGPLTVTADNGRIELRDVVSPFLDLTADDGRMVLDRVTADGVSIVSDNGRIDVARSVLRGGKIKTDNGRVVLGLDPRSNVTVSAQASSGSVVAEPPLAASIGNGEDQPSIIRVGSGAGRLDVGSDDGSITVRAGDVNHGS